MNQLSVGFFQAGFPAPDGTTTAVTGLATALSRNGHRVTIYGCGEADRQFAPLPSKNLTVRLYPKPKRGGFLVPSPLIRRLSTNADELSLLVINTMFNPPNIAVARACKRGGIRYVVSPHDPFHPYLLRKNRIRKSVYLHLFERPYVRGAAAVQILSKEHARYLGIFGHPNALVIPNGFHPELRLEPTLGAQLESPILPGQPRLLSLGRVDVHHKGLDLLLQGFAASIRDAIIPRSAVLSIVGPDNGGISVLRSLAKREGIEKNIHFTGRVSDTTREAMVRNCDALLLCSRYDGFGFVVLEAMLAKKPVIVSKEAGIAIHVEAADCGFSIEPTKIGVRTGLQSLMNAREAAAHQWQVMGRNGYDYAHLHLTWEKAAQSAAHCYTQLIDQTRENSGGRSAGRLFSWEDHSRPELTKEHVGQY